MSKDKRLIVVFSLSYFLVLGMLFLLQNTNPPLFYVFLVIMHLGIASLALIRSGYNNSKIKKNFVNAYITFALFLPILVYKLLGLIFKYDVNEDIIKTISFILIALSIIVGIINVISLNQKLKKGNN